MDIVDMFDGATHVNKLSGEAVKAVCWAKDGAHPRVERYPIERREYKGILEIEPKNRLALRFSDWVLEDRAGRLTVKSLEQFRDEYSEIA